MNIEDHFEAYPLNFGLRNNKNKRYFEIDCFFPLCDVSHGKLRTWEKLLTLEILSLDQARLRELYPMTKIEENKKSREEINVNAHTTSLVECLEKENGERKKQKGGRLQWNKSFFAEYLKTEKLVSDFGIDYPQGNNLVVIEAPRHEGPASLTQEMKSHARGVSEIQEENSHNYLAEEDDILYSSCNEFNPFYILDLYGFILSPRHGVKPSPVSVVLQAPCHRAVSESFLWNQYKKQNPRILQPPIQKVPPQTLQVERHSCPLYYIYSRFHGSIPFLQDREYKDEQLYPWIGWKPYQKYNDLDLLQKKQNLLQTPITVSPTSKEKYQIRFALNESVIKYYKKKPTASYTTYAREEKELRMYFSVASTWSRSVTLFDKSHKEYIFNHRIPLYKPNDLYLTYPSIPQQWLEKFILFSPNPGIYKNKNSSMRGKTHAENAVKEFKKFCISYRNKKKN